MKLITKAIERKAKKFPLYSQDGKGDEAVVIVKFFGGSSFSAYITEMNLETGEMFGLIDHGMGAELGYLSLNELKATRFPPFGLGVERDRYFEGNIGDARKELKKTQIFDR